MKKIILSAFSACLAFLLMADSLVGSSKPFSVMLKARKLKEEEVRLTDKSWNQGLDAVGMMYCSSASCDGGLVTSTLPLLSSPVLGFLLF